MLFVREFTVRKHERGLLYRNGDFVRFLAPAVYRFFDPRKRIDVERFDLTQPAFEHRLVDYLVRWQPEAVEDLFLRVETGADQLAVITKNGHPWTVVGPERRALFWKGVAQVRAELVDVSTELAVAPRIVRAIAADRATQRSSLLERAALLREVPEAHAGLLYVDGRLVRELAPGLHAFWKIDRGVTVELCDLRSRTLDVSSREVPSRDNVSLNVALSADYCVRNAALAARTIGNAEPFVARQLRAAVRAVVSARVLEALLEHQAALGDEVVKRVRDGLDQVGIELRDVQIRGVQLLDDDSSALRLKELEALERITAKVGSVAVYGDLTGVLNELVRIRL